MTIFLGARKFKKHVNRAKLVVHPTNFALFQYTFLFDAYGCGAWKSWRVVFFIVGDGERTWPNIGGVLGFHVKFFTGSGLWSSCANCIRHGLSEIWWEVSFIM